LCKDNYLIRNNDISKKCVGKIALFAKASASALARGALAMCAMCVGFLSSFFAGGRKNKINFLQICTVLS